MATYHDAPGRLFYMGTRFKCPCGVDEFQVEIGPEPARFWCSCGQMYTEDIVNALGKESEKSGE